MIAIDCTKSLIDSVPQWPREVFVVRSERQPDFMVVDKFSVTDKDRRGLLILYPCLKS